jgi:hypothetical protein
LEATGTKKNKYNTKYNGFWSKPCHVEMKPVSLLKMNAVNSLNTDMI